LRRFARPGKEGRGTTGLMADAIQNVTIQLPK
jgi:hypothetical protein